MTAAHMQSQSDEEHDRPVQFRRVDPRQALAADAFLPIAKEGGVYVARLGAPLTVQTPAMALATAVWDDEEGGTLPHAHLAMPPAFAEFAAGVEAAALGACLANKGAWFRRPVDDQTVVAGFKHMCKPSGHIKVGVADGLAAFDHAGEPVPPASLAEGTEVRCILRLDGLTFGRTEFGALWTLLQAQTRPPAPPAPQPPRCLISADEDDDGSAGGSADGSAGFASVPRLHVQEFL